jgi:hypothetical protein
MVKADFGLKLQLRKRIAGQNRYAIHFCNRKIHGFTLFEIPCTNLRLRTAFQKSGIRTGLKLGSPKWAKSIIRQGFTQNPMELFYLLFKLTHPLLN